MLLNRTPYVVEPMENVAMPTDPPPPARSATPR